MIIRIYPKISDRCIVDSNRGDIFASYIIGRIIKDMEFNLEIEIPDFGGNMSSQLQKYYRYRFFESEDFNLVEFKDIISEFLRQNNDNYIKFWDCFSIIVLKAFDETISDNERVIIDEKMLLYILKMIKDYEQKNNVKIHKGSPYYLLGTAYISEGELLKGFSYVHQALEEDKRIGHSTGAALPFLTLDNVKNLNPTIDEIIRFIYNKLIKYRISRRGTLTFNDFRSNFLQRQDIQDIVFQFDYTIFRLKEIIGIDKELLENDFGALTQKDIIFDFCLIIENILWSKTHKTGFSNNLEVLSATSFLIFDKQQLKEIKRLGEVRKNDFSKNLRSILNSQFKFQDGTLLLDIEKDFIITYGFRNFGGHKIESWPIVYQNFDNIIEYIFNALFFSIEFTMV